MTSFEQLGLKVNASVSEIKAAYAKKLKNTRPDTDPEGFQVLHSAYKEALAYAKYPPSDTQAQQTSDDAVLEDDSSRCTDEPSAKQSEVAKISEERATHVQQLAGQFISSCEDVLQDEARRNEIQSWTFLSKNPHILDPDLNFQVGLFVFEYCAKAVHDFNSIDVQTRKKSRLKEPFSFEVLLFLSGIFSWKHNVWEYEYHIDPIFIDTLWPVIEEEDNLTTSTDLASIRGGKGLDLSEGLSEAQQQALDTIQKFSTALCIYVSFGVVLGVLKGYEDIGVDSLIVGAFFLGMLFLLWFGVRANSLLAFGFFILLCFILLLNVPIGSVVGAIGLYLCFRARKAIGKSTRF